MGGIFACLFVRFAHRKTRMGPAIRTVGLARAKTDVTMAAMACDMSRLRWLPDQAKPSDGLMSA